MNPNPEPPEKQRQASRAWTVAVSAVSELLAWVAFSLLAGRKLDAWLGTEPWLLLVSVLAGISIGLYRLIRETTPPSKSGEKRG
ncbi:MAG TPA: AtpZ/AtpI family protein [Elusimicrobiota bacterium]|jgi:F0F1-type ATP synthase assembly protein I|nr:AtpZ/AtpI family protein [Elusimicrobiota bacterium]